MDISGFGKFKSKDTRFDITGGSASLFVLASRLLTMAYKTASGDIVEIQDGRFGGMDTMDLIWNYAENKLSPLVSAIALIPPAVHEKRDWLDGELVTPAKIAKGLLVPLPIETIQELIENPNSANIIVSMMLETHAV